MLFGVTYRQFMDGESAYRALPQGRSFYRYLFTLSLLKLVVTASITLQTLSRLTEISQRSNHTSIQQVTKEIFL
ncbi:hypothetical protein O9992_26870 [Vibrio lentus]|nr:hypothetical protein [Vibrio lentus]